MVMQILPYLGLALLVLAFSVVAYQFADGPSSRRPELGPRGAIRKQVLSTGGLFASVEPPMRFLAARIARLPIARLRASMAERIAVSGDWLGLTADEFFALCALGGICGCGLGLAFVWLAGASFMFVVIGTGCGALLPVIEIDSARARRHLQVNRGLPPAIDLATMCVGAGLDFPSSLRQVVQNMVARDDGLRRELERILQELALGRTRRSAMEGFIERVPIEAVKDFAGSIILAEEKGTPLIDVLRIQANTLRMRRSVLAEELAARAGVKMIFALMLMFGCVFLLLLGPFIVTLVETGL
jgi:tight adherence protein C